MNVNIQEEHTSTQNHEDINLFGDCGLDIQAGQTWIYPTNYPVREYQFNITSKALFHNTLVSLPTGLGKTFIAAVVMYNFYRWYPNGKVIFIAPTRPLVKQQVEACYNIMAIPADTTAEITGSKERLSRTDIWKTKRVFFVTPQVLQNDLSNFDELGPQIRCIVFDEAHKARGNHAYCEVIKRLRAQNSYFRVLALSATPGNTVKDIQDVITRLLISHLEFRTEESSDVAPYVHKRSIEVTVVMLGDKLQQVKNDYLMILERYTRCLIQHKVVNGNCSMLTKGRIFMTLKDFQEKHKTNRGANYSEIVRNLNICLTLYHAYELLIRHGLRSFQSFFEEHIDKPILRGNVELLKIMEDIKQYLGILTMCEPLPDGSYTDVPPDVKFGHPKFYKLQEILISHFKDTNHSSRVIVFFEYRESVKEAYALLMQSKPLVRPKIFLGQGSGMTQRVQMQVVQSFRDGQCNTLLSTCIGEEGFDVGEVDLIICFDISNKSPIRMVQRMGRTGRKREGKIIILVTEGKEQQTLKECLAHKQHLNTNLSDSHELKSVLYTDCPRMLPPQINPKCEKVHITIKKIVSKKNMNLRDMFKNKCLDALEMEDSTEFRAVSEKLPKITNFWKERNPLSLHLDSSVVSYCRNIEKQRVLQPYGEVKHSCYSKALVSLLQISDSKRFNIPATQYSGVSYPHQHKNFRQGDIRSIFSGIKASQETLLHTVSNNEAEVKLSNYELPDDIFSEVTNFLSIKQSIDVTCNICNDLFICSDYSTDLSNLSIKSFNQPHVSVLSTINNDILTEYSESCLSKTADLSEIKNSADEKTLNFFKLRSLEDIFENFVHSADELKNINNTTFESLETFTDKPNSFVLSGQGFTHRNKAVNARLNDTTYSDILIDSGTNSFLNSTNVNKNPATEEIKNEPLEKLENSCVDLQEICDMSSFGLEDLIYKPKEVPETLNKRKLPLDHNDFNSVVKKSKNNDLLVVAHNPRLRTKNSSNPTQEDSSQLTITQLVNFLDT